ncbi:DUF3302 domain-containing protein [Pseudoalteromonas sp. C2R02]|uniref:DUF3302 domain-containing protein n=1 Tax=Pseudoalteromonas sp. C2R02 TaxID=2841565 RepID=UPI001C0987DD|nr:DUF3302 domain-containing protein [Pseudoalteromonas sp. C2R02]MBU2970552.1 DUF3302 domain-containing protein [Pseudoalteromonas sp. C2R02]
MFLDYFALFLVCFVFIAVFYGIIVIHDIPYEIAVHRNHPHQDAIHVAGWISLFTLGVIWPFLWIWATLYREDRGWGFKEQVKENKFENQLSELQKTVQQLQKQIADKE